MDPGFAHFASERLLDMILGPTMANYYEKGTKIIIIIECAQI